MELTPIMLEERRVDVRLGPFTLEGSLGLPRGVSGLVLVPHGGGPPPGPRRQALVSLLRQGGLGTLTIDLLTPAETAIDQRSGELRADIDLLAARLVEATEWVGQHPDTRRLRPGYLGSDLLAAPVLAAAAARPTLVGAVVSIGGRPDLASEHLARVEASTLLLVGDQDVPAIGLSEFALDRLSSPKRLDLIPGAGSLYDDPAALEAAGRRARDWFTAHLLPVGA